MSLKCIKAWLITIGFALCRCIFAKPNILYRYYWEYFWSLILGKGGSLIIYFVLTFLYHSFHICILFTSIYDFSIIPSKHIQYKSRSNLFSMRKHTIYVQFIYSLNFRSFLTIIWFLTQQIVWNDNRFKFQ
jgi:hypothetical protein